MATSRDDFVIAIRSAFLKKKDKQKFSLISLIFLSIFALIYGFAHGGFFAIASPSVADYFGIKSHGMVFGLILFFGTLGGTLGPIIAGKIFDMTKTYENAFIILTIISIIGVLLASRLPRKNAINI